ncbi:hypothetical protein [Antarcticimicrobium sediminis]|uniref:Uncharacterized protein n=1 Tax=Antarcticimicrobium sediminis TaxID=2546227 RepID=A0A4R5ES64_9RHOB|nr:hypothetical protein [Antarcticimicrobium sediminis]TDE37513.1 hypothetical protein E1B25_12390 [Antarcticimicrobium sediminis]
MAEEKVEGPALKKLVKLGMKKRLSFAFYPAASGNDHTVLIDRRKPAKVLGQAAKQMAKKEGAGPKVAFGTFVLDDGTLELTCDVVIPRLAKLLKKYLKSQKVLVNVLVLDAQGTVLESDVEPLPQDAGWDEVEDADDANEEVAAPTTKAPTDPAAETTPAEPPAPAALDAKGLVIRLKAVQPALVTAPAPMADKLKKAVALAVAQIKAQDLAAADKTIAALEKAASRLGPKAGAPETSAPAPGEAAATKPAQDGAPRQLAARAGALRDVIATLHDPARSKLTTALGNAAQRIEAGDLVAASDGLARIEAATNKMVASVNAGSNSAAQTEATPKAEAAAEAPDPQAAKWRTAEARLQPEIDRLIAEKRGDLAALNRTFAYAQDQAAAGQFDKALAAAGQVVALIKQAKASTTTAAAAQAQAAAPDNVVDYTKSRLGWIKTRQSLRNELEGLKNAIVSATTGIEGMEDVPAKSGVLFDYLDDIDSTLEDTLKQLVEAPDGDRREGLKKSARKIIGDYQGLLDTDFFKAVDGSGFARTKIRASALNALQDVSGALAS